MESPDQLSLTEGHAFQALQQSLKDLEQAYANFFARRAEFLRFKQKGYSDSSRYPQGTKLDQTKTVCTCQSLAGCATATAGRYLSCRFRPREIERPTPNGNAIGIDVGIARFASFDRSLPEFDKKDYLPHLSSFKGHQIRLRKTQREMSRKTKFSSNWKKARIRVQRIHFQIGNARRNYLHKASTTISQNHAMVCIEDL